MKVKIKNVMPGEVDESLTPVVIYNYRVELLLKNNQEILVYNFNHDLSDKIGKQMECVIFAEKSTRKNPIYKISGKLLRNFKIDSENIDKFYFPNILIEEGIMREEHFDDFIRGITVIMTENGEFHIDDDPKYQEGDIIDLDIDKFHINAFYVIE